MTLIILRIIGQVLSRMTVGGDLFADFLMIRLGLWVSGGEDPRGEVFSHHILSRVLSSTGWVAGDGDLDLLDLGSVLRFLHCRFILLLLCIAVFGRNSLGTSFFFF